MKKLLITLILGILAFMAGCQTAKGIFGDTGWLLNKAADNIQPEQDK